MTFRAVMVASLLLVSSSPVVAAEHYRCDSMIEDSALNFKRDNSDFVLLTIDGVSVHSLIHLGSATRDLTFQSCARTTADGSNFSRWFPIECRHLDSYDGAPYTMEPYLIGAYAGISPIIDEEYTMYPGIERASRSAGIDIPIRTFVVYASRKPIYEFFCQLARP